MSWLQSGIRYSERKQEPQLLRYSERCARGKTGIPSCYFPTVCGTRDTIVRSERMQIVRGVFQGRDYYIGGISDHHHFMPLIKCVRNTSALYYITSTYINSVWYMLSGQGFWMNDIVQRLTTICTPSSFATSCFLCTHYNSFFHHQSLSHDKYFSKIKLLKSLSLCYSQPSSLTSICDCW